MSEQEDTRTIDVLAKQALEVQDACNFVAVANHFGRAMVRLRRLLNVDDAGLRNHPITTLWLSKINSMVPPASPEQIEVFGDGNFEKAYVTVEELSQTKGE